MRDLLPHDLLAADAARLAGEALHEDGERDVTSLVAVGDTQRGTALIVARHELVLAGSAYADAIVAACALPSIDWCAEDGAVVPAGGEIGTLRGSLRALLRAERPLLNILQRASGIATTTREYARAISETSSLLLHTRKTTPGLRIFEVAAALAGGAAPHRFDLAHAVMVKDNHWQALRNANEPLDAALARAAELGITSRYVEVETREQVLEACRAGATRIVIDNQSPETVRSWAALARATAPDVEVEATGGITLGNVRQYAAAGVDYVSVGALTHSPRAADIAVDVNPA